MKYREKYINSLGTWKSIPDRPEFFFSKIANDNISSVSPPRPPDPPASVQMEPSGVIDIWVKCWWLWFLYR